MEGLREILANLLTVNPYFRWTATECLAHPIFDDIRDPTSDYTPRDKIKLDIDQDDAFDYEKGISDKFDTYDHTTAILKEVN